MTVSVTAQQTFQADKARVSSYVRETLDRNPIYKRVYERPDGARFSAIVRPNIPLILGTDISIRLEEVGDRTTVTATVESQAFIMGDAFGFYERYIREFFTALERIASAEGVRPSSKLVFKTSNNWVPVVFSVVVLFFLLTLFGSFQVVSWAGLFILAFVVIVLAGLVRLVRDAHRPG
jgi:hypothetical protein